MFALEYEGRSDLQNIAHWTGAADQESPVTQPVHDCGGAIGFRLLRSTILHPLHADEHSVAANIGELFGIGLQLAKFAAQVHADMFDIGCQLLVLDHVDHGHPCGGLQGTGRESLELALVPSKFIYELA